MFGIQSSLILTIHIGLGLLGELLQIFIDYFDLNEWTYS